MERVSIESPSSLSKAVRVLAAGLAVVVPTDTVYGVGCDVFNEMAIRRLFEMKRRDAEKSIPVLVSDEAMLKTIARLDDTTAFLLRECWPGALTAVLFAQSAIPQLLHPGTPAIGIRIPNHPFLVDLIRAFGKPLAVTSANISGKGPYTRIEDVLRDFHGQSEPELVLDAGDLPPSGASTVVDFTKSPPVVLREGAISKERLRELFETHFP